jgi:hypothetical protein
MAQMKQRARINIDRDGNRRSIAKLFGRAGRRVNSAPIGINLHAGRRRLDLGVEIAAGPQRVREIWKIVDDTPRQAGSRGRRLKP